MGVAFCSNICTVTHYEKGITRVEIQEPNDGEKYAVNMDCLMYFPDVEVIK
jgi:hypothetical protein